METRKYQDHDIEPDDNWRFKVSGPLFAKQETFDSMAQAKSAINARREADAKQKKAAITMAIVCLDDKGEIVTVKGIHAGQSQLLGVGDARSVYPNVPFLKDALVRRTRLQAELVTLNNLLGPYAVHVSRGYGRIRPDEYERYVSVFERDFSTAKTKAEQRESDKVVTLKA